MKSKQPWPTKAAMTQVYEKKLWGGADHDFYSGSGSHEPALVEPYVEAVTSFLSDFHPPLTVCDLGCGDFNVGKELLPFAEHYIAIDIVPELIDRNQQLLQVENLSFHCLDISQDELPKADCVLLRQVLQHLSNAEIKSVVKNLPQYQYLILTEHLPEGAFTPNVDIISGQGIRLKKHSGVELLAPPFNLKVKEQKTLLCLHPSEGEGVIVTTLYQLG